MRWLILGVVLLHGAIHLLGFAKAFGYAELPQLQREYSRRSGVAWLLAAILFVAAGLAIVIYPIGWWVLGGAGVLLSQTLICMAWRDAKFGTLTNLILLFAMVATGRASEGIRQASKVVAYPVAVLKTSEIPPDGVLELNLPTLELQAPVRRLTPGLDLRQRMASTGPLHVVSPFVDPLAVHDLGEWVLVLHRQHCEVFSVKENAWWVYTWSDGFPGIADSKVTAEAFVEGVVLHQPTQLQEPHVAFDSAKRNWFTLDESGYQSLRKRWHSSPAFQPTSSWRVNEWGVQRRILPDTEEESIALPGSDIQVLTQMGDQIYAALRQGGIRVFTSGAETGFLSARDLNSSAPIRALKGDGSHLAVVHPHQIDVFEVNRAGLDPKYRLKLPSRAPTDDSPTPTALCGDYLCYGDGASLVVVEWATQKQVTKIHFESPILEMLSYRDKVIVQTCFGFALFKPKGGSLRHFLKNAQLAVPLVASDEDEYESQVTSLGIRGNQYWFCERTSESGKGRPVACDLLTEKLLPSRAVGLPSEVEAKWVDYQPSLSRQLWSQGVLVTLEVTGRKPQLQVLDARQGRPVASFTVEGIFSSGSRSAEEIRGEFVTQCQVDGNRLWVGTDKAFFVVDLMTRKCRCLNGGETFHYSGNMVVTPDAVHIFFDSARPIGDWCRLDRQTWQSRIMHFSQPFFDPLSARSLDTRILFATNSGAGLYDTATGQTRLLPTAVAAKQVAFLDQGYVVASAKALFLFDSQAQALGSIPFDVGAEPEWIDVVDRNVWLWSGDRLVCVDPATRVQKRFAIDFVNGHLAADRPMAITAGTKEIPLFLFARDGITGFDPRDGHVRFITGDFFKEQGLLGMCEEGDQCYLSTQKGLFRFDKARLTLEPSCWNPKGMIKLRATAEAYYLLTHDDGIFRFDRATFLELFRHSTMKMGH